MDYKLIYYDKAFTTIFFLILTTQLSAQSLLGAWEAEMTYEGRTLRNVVILAEGYQVATFYDAETGTFVSSIGELIF